jgi:hypothetical protein
LRGGGSEVCKEVSEEAFFVDWDPRSRVEGPKIVECLGQAT